MKDSRAFILALLVAMTLWFICPVHAAEPVADVTTATNSQAIQGQSQDLTIKGADPIRSIQISPSVPVTMRGGPSYFAGPPIDTGPLFIPLAQLVPILNAVDVTDQGTINNEDDIEAEMEVLQAVQPAACDDVTFQLAKTEADYTDAPLAVISIRADDYTANSASLARKLARMAKSVGGSRIVFLKEGVTKRLHSSGWGIGINNNISVVNASPTGIGGVASGGTGYSSGDAEYYSLPYLIAVVLR